MAVFQGARLRNTSMPSESAVRPRARNSRLARPLDSTRPASGARPMGILIAVILVTTMVGLAYLTQTLGSNATSDEISRLTAEGNDLRNVITKHDDAVDFYTDPGRVAKRAGELGLKPLDDLVVLKAR